MSEYRFKKNLKDQVLGLTKIVQRQGTKLHHVKAHGALYNDLMESDLLSTLFVREIISINPELKILAMPDSTLHKTCDELGAKCITEVFADRSYESAKKLRSRNLKNALLIDIDEISQRVYSLRNGKLRLHNGKLIELRAETVCIHSDTKDAIEMVKVIRELI